MGDTGECTVGFEEISDDFQTLHLTSIAVLLYRLCHDESQERKDEIFAKLRFCIRCYSSKRSDEFCLNMMFIAKCGIARRRKEMVSFTGRNNGRQVPIKYLKLTVDALQYLMDQRTEKMIIITASSQVLFSVVGRERCPHRYSGRALPLILSTGQESIQTQISLLFEQTWRNTRSRTLVGSVLGKRGNYRWSSDAKVIIAGKIFEEIFKWSTNGRTLWNICECP